MNTKRNNKNNRKNITSNIKVDGFDKSESGAVNNLETNKKIGDLGENIAVVFLEKRGFNIVDRNYRDKTGEIDIIAQKDDFYYIIEVKTLKIPSGQEFDIMKRDSLFNPNISIIRDGEGTKWLKPEINLTKDKLRKIKQMALRYCLNFGIKEESLKFMGVCISLYHSGSRVTKTNILSCKVKVLPLFE